MNIGNLIILGARGSHPTPDRDKMTYGGHTTAFAISLRRSKILVDAGSGDSK